jgi:predicted PurR-regulated permease PerM
MINDYIKKLIFVLLLILILYLTYLALPFAVEIGRFILRIIVPFLFAFAVAFILQPVVVFVQRFIKNRIIAVLVVLLLFVGLVFLAGYLISPYLIRELKVLIENLPKIMHDLEIAVDSFADRLDFLPDNYRPTFENLNTFLSGYLADLANLPNVILDKFFKYAGLLVVIPMTIIYFLIDYEKILCKLRDYLIAHNREHCRNYLGEMHKVLSSYVRGTFLVMVILFVVCSIVFMILDLDFALFFAIVCAITNVIPYLGPYLGAVFPVLYALITSPTKALIVAGCIFIIQNIESNILTPYINSKRIKTHPLIGIMFLLAFERIFGFLGMIFATPVLAIIRITLKYYNPFKKKAV